MKKMNKAEKKEFEMGAAKIACGIIYAFGALLFIRIIFWSILTILAAFI